MVINIKPLQTFIPSLLPSVLGEFKSPTQGPRPSLSISMTLQNLHPLPSFCAPAQQVHQYFSVSPSVLLFISGLRIVGTPQSHLGMLCGRKSGLQNRKVILILQFDGGYVTHDPGEAFELVAMSGFTVGRNKSIVDCGGIECLNLS